MICSILTSASTASTRVLPTISSASKHSSTHETPHAVGYSADLWASSTPSVYTAASVIFGASGATGAWDSPPDERCKIWIDAGWQLRYGAVSRTLAQCVVQPGLGKGFSRFANVEVAVEPLLRTMIHTGVTLLDARHCIVVRTVSVFPFILP